MLLTITTTHKPATDLGYLLHKHPARIQSFELPFGKAQVFYPEASFERCTAALLLEIDPVRLVRGPAVTLDQYVNDRPYVASSFLSVAIARVFSTALGGRSKERPELAEKAIPLQARLAVLPCRGGEELLRRLFEPLGYTLTAQPHPLDERLGWGKSDYYTVTLEATCRLSELLRHLYVLIPVLDDEKHYWIGEEEVEKLLRHGGEWLATHPERELIARRYLKHQYRLTHQALTRLLEEDQPDPDMAEVFHAKEEEAIEGCLGLNEQRLEAVMAVLKSHGVKRVLDLGCGEGHLLQRLLEDRNFKEIVGLDVSHSALERARKRLRWDRFPPEQKARLRLIQGSLLYRDKRLAGYDAAAVIEVIEHLNPARLVSFERVIFEFARPNVIIITTPNVEYNIKFEGLPAGQFRHKDHHFEWTRAEFQVWAREVAERFSYIVHFRPVGPEDPVVGPPTQMGVFTLTEGDHHEDHHS